MLILQMKKQFTLKCVGVGAPDANGQLWLGVQFVSVAQPKPMQTVTFGDRNASGRWRCLKFVCLSRYATTCTSSTRVGHVNRSIYLFARSHIPLLPKDSVSWLTIPTLSHVLVITSMLEISYTLLPA
jgi:hypothetical protein